MTHAPSGTALPTGSLCGGLFLSDQKERCRYEGNNVIERQSYFLPEEPLTSCPPFEPVPCDVAVPVFVCVEVRLGLSGETVVVATAASIPAATTASVTLPILTLPSLRVVRKQLHCSTRRHKSEDTFCTRCFLLSGCAGRLPTQKNRGVK